ncbi:MAG: hypothetical protein JXD22_13310 [Sedimentisphaerales bacterium]|nr:hypothetical protein [Sedimentisphaerales bacterium]
MSSELAKSLLVASCVIVIVSTGFIMFSTSSSAVAVDLGVYVKCEACGAVKSYSGEDFTKLAEKQFNELKSTDPELVADIKYEISAIPVRDDMPANMLPKPSDEQLEQRIIALWGSKARDIPMKCEKCGKYECFKAFKCKKCGEIFVIEKPQEEFSKMCSKCDVGQK